MTHKTHSHESVTQRILDDMSFPISEHLCLSIGPDHLSTTQKHCGVLFLEFSHIQLKSISFIFSIDVVKGPLLLYLPIAIERLFYSIC